MYDPWMGVCLILDIDDMYVLRRIRSALIVELNARQ